MMPICVLFCPPHWAKVKHHARLVRDSYVAGMFQGNDAAWILSKDI